MSILVVDVGVTNLSLTCQRGGHAAPRRVGSKPISHAGEETSSIRAELMVVPVVLTHLTPAIIATLRTLFKNGAQVACSGDVFNNASATIVCSGTLSDEFEPAGPWFVGNLTLYEIGTSLGYSPSTGLIYLTNVDSVVDPGDSSIKLATTNILDDPFVIGVNGECRILDAATPTTCGTVPDPTTACATTFSLVPEKTWLTPGALSNGYLTGTPYITMQSIGGTADRWAHQSNYCKIFVVRSSVDLVEWDTSYGGNGGFAGGEITLTCPDAVIFTVQIGDQIRVETYGRLALHAGYADDQPADLARQTIGYGVGGAVLHIGGGVLFQ